MAERVGRGSLTGQWQRRPGACPNIRGGITLERDLPANTRLWLTGWTRTIAGGAVVSLLVEIADKGREEFGPATGSATRVQCRSASNPNRPLRIVMTRRPNPTSVVTEFLRERLKHGPVIVSEALLTVSDAKLDRQVLGRGLACAYCSSETIPPPRNRLN